MFLEIYLYLILNENLSLMMILMINKLVQIKMSHKLDNNQTLLEEDKLQHILLVAVEYILHILSNNLNNNNSVEIMLHNPSYHCLSNNREQMDSHHH